MQEGRIVIIHHILKVPKEKVEGSSMIGKINIIF
jgi:hypothetical protein